MSFPIRLCPPQGGATWRANGPGDAPGSLAEDLLLPDQVEAYLGPCRHSTRVETTDQRRLEESRPGAGPVRLDATPPTATHAPAVPVCHLGLGYRMRAWRCKCPTAKRSVP